MKFRPHQQAIYNAATSGEFRELWARGAIRSGKTEPLGAATVRRMITYPGPYFVTNSTAGNVWAVQYPKLRKYGKVAGVKVRRGRVESLPVIWVGPSFAYVVGLKNKGSEDPFMGRDSRGGWYEEPNKCNQTAFDMVLGRGSLPDTVHLMGMNPEGPRHWSSEYCKAAMAGERRGWHIQTRLTDADWLEDDYVAYLESIYTLPHLRRRYIDGEFAAGEGLVYQYVPEADECATRGGLAIAADAGASSVTAAIYARQQPDGSWVIFDEYYYDSHENPQLGEREHAAAILAKHGPPDDLIVDGSNFRHEFSELGVWGRTPQKDIEDGVAHLDSRFRAGMVKFLTGTCPNTRAEFDTLEWDENARLRGESVPVDGFDHGADCVRYFAKAKVPRYSELMRY